MSIQAMVLGGKQTPIDVSGLLGTYDRMVSRSRAERAKLQRELAIAGDGAIVNVMDMFKLPEAYTADRWPTVAMAPIKADKIYFTYQEHGMTGFHVDERPDNKHLKVAPPPPPEYSSEEREAQHKHFMEMMKYGIFGLGAASRGKGDHMGSVKVPMVPQELMPKTGFLRRKISSGDHWVLFDSPVWKPEALPVDPYLLERMDDTRFRVLAHWDLTPKERQLMAMIRE